MKKIVTLVLCLSILFISTIVYACEIEWGKTYEIVGIKSNNVQSGWFFAFMGFIKNDFYYFLYLREGDKSINLYKFSIDECDIYDDIKENKKPYFFYETNDYGRYEIHIPPNSINNL